jgi:hypothetical protein
MSAALQSKLTTFIRSRRFKSYLLFSKTTRTPGLQTSDNGLGLGFRIILGKAGLITQAMRTLGHYSADEYNLPL